MQFNEIIDTYPDYYFIYTDGSKANEKVACAFSCKNGKITFRLPDNSSLFTAEAKAVERALQFIKINPIRKKYFICTDSLSLIQSIENGNLKNPLIGSILREIFNIKQQGKDILFCWVPSHCGIAGNEKADQAAKGALNNPVYPFKIPYSDKHPLINSFIQNK